MKWKQIIWKRPEEFFNGEHFEVFKDGINPYIQEIDDILKDHEDRVYARKDLVEVDAKKLEEGVRKILESTVALCKETPNIVV